MTAPLTPRERAVRLLAIRVLKDRIAEEEKALRDDAAADLLVGEKVVGALLDDQELAPIGYVQLTKGRESAAVVDRDALLAWAEKYAPGEVITTRAVRESFITHLLAEVKQVGGWFDRDTGEIVPVDGVEVRTGSPILQVKPNDDADRLVVEALAGRRMALPGGEP